MSATAYLSVLREGGLIAFPTDTFFALSCDALNPEAVDRLRTIKNTPGRPLPVLVPSEFDCRELQCTINATAADLIARFWPGKLTLVVPCAGRLAGLVGRPEDGAVGLRVPDHPAALDILRSWNGPLVGTSANPPGRVPAKSAAEVRAYFGSEISWVAEGESPGGAPSTVAIISDSGMRVERRGAISLDTLRPWISA